MATEVQDDVVFDSVEALSRAKSQAESRVKLIRSLLAESEIEATDFRKVQILYNDARADVNSGLDRLLIELETTSSHQSAEPYNRVAERAAKRVTEFMEASDALILGKGRSGMVEAGLKLGDSIVNALVDVWKTLRGERKERRALLIQRLETLKWAQFDDI